MGHHVAQGGHYVGTARALRAHWMGITWAQVGHHLSTGWASREHRMGITWARGRHHVDAGKASRGHGVGITWAQSRHHVGTGWSSRRHMVGITWALRVHFVCTWWASLGQWVCITWTHVWHHLCAGWAYNTGDLVAMNRHLIYYLSCRTGPTAVDQTYDKESSCVSNLGRNLHIIPAKLTAVVCRALFRPLWREGLRRRQDSCMVYRGGLEVDLHGLRRWRF